MLTAKEAPQAAGTLEAAAEYLSQHGAVSVCQHCGAEKSVDAANMGGAYMLLCDECYASVRRMIELNQNLRNTQKENFWGGIAGASGGALLGAFCIFLIAQLGYIAAVSGAVLSICTLAGYKLSLIHI